VAKTRKHLVQRDTFLAGVRSPPLQERRSKVRWPRRGRPGDEAKGGFLGGTHSVRPLSMAKRVPRDSVFTGWQGEAWSPTGICLGQAGALFAGVRSPPLQERRSKVRWPYGGKPGDDAKGGFLGGTHSVRPLSMAKRVPRDSVFTGWQGEAWSPTGICLGQARALFAGVRSPPLRGEAKRRREGLTGANPEMARKAVFSEGRTLCVRLAWPNVCRGISFPPACAGEKPGHPRGYVSVKPVPSLRACGARPFAGRPSEGEKALRGQTRRWRERRFSRRDALCASA
jgi:hypothetical protein